MATRPAPSAFSMSAPEMTGRYRIAIEISLAAVLLLLIGVTRLPLRLDGSFEIIQPEQEVVMMEEVVPTKQPEKPPPPPRPQVPIAVSDDAVLSDEPLQLDAALDLDAAVELPAPPLGPPPPPPTPDDESEAEIFVVVEQMPELIGGTAALYAAIEYPEIARKAGVEGMVVVQVIIETDGRPTAPTVTRTAGDILDEAAIKGIMTLRFEPGLQRGRAVRVRYVIPVRFRLRQPNK